MEHKGAIPPDRRSIPVSKIPPVSRPVRLSLPENWNYTTRGLAAICKEGVDSIGTTLRELESAGYLARRRLRGQNGRISDTEYIVYEHPCREPASDRPDTVSPCTENPDMVIPHTAAPRSVRMRS